MYRRCKGSSCSFPEHWRGKWFQQGMGEIEITDINVTEHGHCVSQDGNNKYLLLNRSPDLLLAKSCFRQLNGLHSAIFNSSTLISS
ncbi:hypothetical protein Btru_027229 [Bulinus truncatus]|nr:hypothetical protein Btru_027229 [Bulinus truncatus]